MASSHYCGILCVFGAAQALGIKADFEELIDEEYVSSKRGSTTKDLLAACERLNLKSKGTGFMTVDQLKAIESPVILHVRAPCAGKKYSHWMLFTGVNEEQLMRVYDPPRDTGYLTEAELLSMWDGTAIIVGESNNTRLPGLISSPAIAALLIVAGILPFGKRKRDQRLTGSWNGVTRICFCFKVQCKQI